MSRLEKGLALTAASAAAFMGFDAAGTGEATTIYKQKAEAVALSNFLGQTAVREAKIINAVNSRDPLNRYGSPYTDANMPRTRFIGFVRSRGGTEYRVSAVTGQNTKRRPIAAKVEDVSIQVINETQHCTNTVLKIMSSQIGEKNWSAQIGTFSEAQENSDPDKVTSPSIIMAGGIPSAARQAELGRESLREVQAIAAISADAPLSYFNPNC